MCGDYPQAKLHYKDKSMNSLSAVFILFVQYKASCAIHSLHILLVFTLYRLVFVSFIFFIYLILSYICADVSFPAGFNGCVFPDVYFLHFTGNEAVT